MKYSKEFKEEALKLSDEIGLKKAAQQLGIQYYTAFIFVPLLIRKQHSYAASQEKSFNTRTRKYVILFAQKRGCCSQPKLFFLPVLATVPLLCFHAISDSFYL